MLSHVRKHRPGSHVSWFLVNSSNSLSGYPFLCNKLLQCSGAKSNHFTLFTCFGGQEFERAQLGIYRLNSFIWLQSNGGWSWDSWWSICGLVRHCPLPQSLSLHFFPSLSPLSYLFCMYLRAYPCDISRCASLGFLTICWQQGSGTIYLLLSLLAYVFQTAQ